MPTAPTAPTLPTVHTVPHTGHIPYYYCTYFTNCTPLQLWPTIRPTYCIYPYKPVHCFHSSFGCSQGVAAEASANDASCHAVEQLLGLEEGLLDHIGAVACGLWHVRCGLRPAACGSKKKATGFSITSVLGHPLLLSSPLY